MGRRRLAPGPVHLLRVPGAHPPVLRATGISALSVSSAGRDPTFYCNCFRRKVKVRAPS